MPPNPSLFSLEAELFNALSHPARLEILDLLRGGESCVCHIQAMLGQRQAYTSQHLNVLRRLGLITSRKKGLRVYYQVSHPDLFALLDQSRDLLQSLDKWQPGLSTATGSSQPVTACTCPQCLSRQADPTASPPEVEYA